MTSHWSLNYKTASDWAETVQIVSQGKNIHHPLALWHIMLERSSAFDITMLHLTNSRSALSSIDQWQSWTLPHFAPGRPVAIQAIYAIYTIYTSSDGSCTNVRSCSLNVHSYFTQKFVNLRKNLYSFNVWLNMESIGWPRVLYCVIPIPIPFLFSLDLGQDCWTLRTWTWT